MAVNLSLLPIQPHYRDLTGTFIGQDGYPYLIGYKDYYDSLVESGYGSQFTKVYDFNSNKILFKANYPNARDIDGQYFYFKIIDSDGVVHIYDYNTSHGESGVAQYKHFAITGYDFIRFSNGYARAIYLNSDGYAYVDDGTYWQDKISIRRIEVPNVVKVVSGGSNAYNLFCLLLTSNGDVYKFGQSYNTHHNLGDDTTRWIEPAEKIASDCVDIYADSYRYSKFYFATSGYLKSNGDFYRAGTMHLDTMDDDVLLFENTDYTRIDTNVALFGMGAGEWWINTNGTSKYYGYYNTQTPTVSYNRIDYNKSVKSQVAGTRSWGHWLYSYLVNTLDSAGMLPSQYLAKPTYNLQLNAMDDITKKYTNSTWSTSKTWYIKVEFVSYYSDSLKPGDIVRNVVNYVTMIRNNRLKEYVA